MHLHEETVESEAKADEDTYDKFKCWCHENTDAKTKAAAEAETTSRELKPAAIQYATVSNRMFDKDDSGHCCCNLVWEPATRKERVEILIAQSERLKGEIETAEDEVDNSFIAKKNSKSRLQVYRMHELKTFPAL